ncbi:MAG: hypothetical protein R6U32_02955 [Candidatus Woesearchaeota archaeon]
MFRGLYTSEGKASIKETVLNSIDGKKDNDDLYLFLVSKTPASMDLVESGPLAGYPLITKDDEVVMTAVGYDGPVRKHGVITFDPSYIFSFFSGDSKPENADQFMACLETEYDKGLRSRFFYKDKGSIDWGIIVEGKQVHRMGGIMRLKNAVCRHYEPEFDMYNISLFNDCFMREDGINREEKIMPFSDLEFALTGVNDELEEAIDEAVRESRDEREDDGKKRRPDHLKVIK